MMLQGIKTIWEWIKTMVSKIADLIPRFRREPAPHVPTDLEKKLGRKILKRKAKMGSPVNTRQGGPNMPRRQPCPLCHKRAKRKRKTMGGAYYHCPIHGEFFVRAPRLL